MDKIIIRILETLFILAEICVIFITYLHSICRYKHIMSHYHNNDKIKDRKYIVVKKQPSTKPIIKSNMTEAIDVNELKRNLNIPALIFCVNNITIQIIKLNQEKTFIGRGKSDDIEINEPTISRSQCFITREESGYFINIDVLRNPILLNDNKIVEEKVKLNDGDVISLGNGKVTFIFTISSNITTPLRA